MRKVAIIVAAVFAAAVGVVPAATAQPTDFDLQAHRGGRGETTEESLRAFTKSLDLGVSTLEFDIVITEDAQPLVWHDPKIDPAQVCRHRARLRRRPGVSIRRQAGSRPHPRPDSHAGLR
jgi:glycerophosphoryl diester phosphodiesterase